MSSRVASSRPGAALLGVKTRMWPLATIRFGGALVTAGNVQREAGAWTSSSLRPNPLFVPKIVLGQQKLMLSIQTCT
jgi:hypothetical protein